MALLLSGCNETAQLNQPPVYYDVAGFVHQQIKALSAAKPLVKKSVLVNEKRDEHTTRTINWTRELELFTQVDINKPALRTSYQISRPDSLTYQYTLKPTEEKLTVRSLLVRIDPATRKPRHIEAVLRTSNPLYSSERHLTLDGGPAGGQPWGISHYRLDGYQKLAYFDKNTFTVDGRVN
ncbi:hypothetical protein [Spirosoma luteolum]